MASAVVVGCLAGERDREAIAVVSRAVFEDRLSAGKGGSAKVRQGKIILPSYFGLHVSHSSSRVINFASTPETTYYHLDSFPPNIENFLDHDMNI